ncbi:hypothetical protein FRB94_011680 [Tulasnella sp. JGI-2019a]|nr:hypothetical protein FRB94_011680 [Tulasnella sp. JGI-2019a]
MNSTMSHLSLLAHPIVTPLLAAAVVVAYHLWAYARDPYGYRALGIPGPGLAKLSDAWLVRIAAMGERSEVVHKEHLKYGPFVRIAPNHISISDPEALQVIYAHGNGALKSDFYDAFVSIRRTIFNTRDRAAHARKRKVVSHVFSPKNVAGFEPNVRSAMSNLFVQMDKICSAPPGTTASIGSNQYRIKEDRAWLDALPWFNYVGFDIIGDLVFGQPFGMVENGQDSAAMASRGDKDPTGTGDTEPIPAIGILDERGAFSATLGTVPLWARSYIKMVPWFARGNKATKNLAGIAIASVAKRLVNPTDRVDILARLQQGKDDNEQSLGQDELTAEALTMLIAGSDTTSISSCVAIYYLARDQRVLRALQKELDDALGSNEEVPWYEQLKKLRYLDACINEALRLHATAAIGLPRVAPPGGLNILGKHFPEGSILSVPTYTLHRDTSIWAEDSEDYRPERWFEIDPADSQKAFNPFSLGPRGCVGRNLAMMELSVIVAAFIRRYDIVLECPAQPLQMKEGILRKPLGCMVGLKQRFRHEQ